MSLYEEISKNYNLIDPIANLKKNTTNPYTWEDFKQLLIEERAMGNVMPFLAGSLATRLMLPKIKKDYQPPIDGSDKECALEDYVQECLITITNKTIAFKPEKDEIGKFIQFISKHIKGESTNSRYSNITRYDANLLAKESNNEYNFQPVSLSGKSNGAKSAFEGDKEETLEDKIGGHLDITSTLEKKLSEETNSLLHKLVDEDADKYSKQELINVAFFTKLAGGFKEWSMDKQNYVRNGIEQAYLDKTNNRIVNDNVISTNPEQTDEYSDDYDRGEEYI